HGKPRISRSVDIVQCRLKVSSASGKKPAIVRMPLTKEIGMFPTRNHLKMARPLGLAMLISMGLASCATYDDEFAGINSRLDQLDTRVQGAAQSAESANQSAQRANQRLDQLESRVQRIESSPARPPRG